MTVEETLQIALDAHKGQKDLDGKPAILHPIAVGIMGSNDVEIKESLLSCTRLQSVSWEAMM